MRGEDAIAMNEISGESNMPISCVSKASLKDSVDLRDRIYRPSLLTLPSRSYPRFLDNDSVRPGIRIRNQGASDRCTGYAMASAIDIQRYFEAHETGEKHGLMENDEIKPVSSRMLFEMGALVSAETSRPGEKSYSIRSAIKGFYHNGVCLEDIWQEDKDTDAPDLDMIDCAKKARGLSLGAYYRLEHHLSDYHNAIREVGAILVSATVHEGWALERVAENKSIVFAEDDRERGAHAFVIVGYDKTGFYVLNSWGPEWGGTMGPVSKAAGIAHWAYHDWAGSIMDAWVLRLAVSTPTAFEYTVGTQGSTFFGSARAGAAQSGGLTPGDDAISVPRQRVLGHYIHIEAGRYVKAGSYPDSKKNLERTLDYLRAEFTSRPAKPTDSHNVQVETSCDGPSLPRNTLDRVYLRVTGDTGTVENAMHRIVLLRRSLRPQGIYPISLVWTARMASAFAVGIKACMQAATERMPDPSDDRNDLIESLIRPIGRPLWNQLKLEAAMVTNATEGKTGPLIKTLKHLNTTLDKRQLLNLHGYEPDLPSRRIDLVFEGAGALVFVEFLRQLGSDALSMLRHVRAVFLAYPVASHASLVEQLRNLRKQTGSDAQARALQNDLLNRLFIIRPNEDFLHYSSIGPYTRTWFHMVNNSFENEPLDNNLQRSLSLTDDPTHSEQVEELASLGISRYRQLTRGPEMKREGQGSAILRTSVVSRPFLDELLNMSIEEPVSDQAFIEPLQFGSDYMALSGTAVTASENDIKHQNSAHSEDAESKSLTGGALSSAAKQEKNLNRQKEPES